MFTIIQKMYKRGGSISRLEFVQYGLLQAVGILLLCALLFLNIEWIHPGLKVLKFVLFMVGLLGLTWAHYLTMFKRVRDIFGTCYSPLWVILSVVPFIQIPLYLFLGAAPSKKT
jgi:uncharacterized membrane protein YhaH (DUF805 family)